MIRSANSWLGLTNLTHTSSIPGEAEAQGYPPPEPRMLGEVAAPGSSGSSERSVPGGMPTDSLRNIRAGGRQPQKY